jgi:hypothetical protein
LVPVGTTTGTEVGPLGLCRPRLCERRRSREWLADPVGPSVTARVLDVSLVDAGGFGEFAASGVPPEDVHATRVAEVAAAIDSAIVLVASLIRSPSRIHLHGTSAGLRAV